MKRQHIHCINNITQQEFYSIFPKASACKWNINHRHPAHFIGIHPISKELMDNILPFAITLTIVYRRAKVIPFKERIIKRKYEYGNENN